MPRHAYCPRCNTYLLKIACDDEITHLDTYYYCRSCRLTHVSVDVGKTFYESFTFGDNALTKHYWELQKRKVYEYEGEYQSEW